SSWPESEISPTPCEPPRMIEPLGVSRKRCSPSGRHSRVAKRPLAFRLPHRGGQTAVLRDQFDVRGGRGASRRGNARVQRPSVGNASTERSGNLFQTGMKMHTDTVNSFGGGGSESLRSRMNLPARPCDEVEFTRS